MVRSMEPSVSALRTCLRISIVISFEPSTLSLLLVLTVASV